MTSQHTISLTSEQSEYARTLPNFSAFVQECLRLHSIGELEINVEMLYLRKKELQRLQFTTMIEKRLARIEQILSEKS
jgi:hypothetical protein